MNKNYAAGVLLIAEQLHAKGIDPSTVDVEAMIRDYMQQSSMLPDEDDEDDDEVIDLDEDDDEEEVQ